MMQEETQEEAELASKVVSSMRPGEHAKRQRRQERELNCQIAALGLLLAVPKLLKGVEEREFLDESIGNAVGGLKRFVEMQDDAALSIAKDWMSNVLGVIVRDGEKLQDALLRTVKENMARKRAGDVLQRLAMMSLNHSISDAAFLEQVRNELGGL